MYNKEKIEKGLIVILKDEESLEHALRRFKKKLKKNNLFEDIKSNRFFEKPSKKKRRKNKENILRVKKEQKNSNLNNKNK